MVPGGEKGVRPTPGERKCAFRGGVAFCGTKVKDGMEGVMGGRPSNGDNGPGTWGKAWIGGEGRASGPSKGEKGPGPGGKGWMGGGGRAIGPGWAGLWDGGCGPRGCGP